MHSIRIIALLLALLVFCSACSSVATTVATPVSAYQTGPDLLPEVACLYQTRHLEGEQAGLHADRRQWHLWRHGDSVKVNSLSSSVGEHWQRLKHNEVALTGLYHDRRFAVHYSPSDLKSIGTRTNWTAKASIISPALLKRLSKVGQTRVLGYEAERYQGRIGSYDLAITWIPQLSIPAMVQQREERGAATEASRVELLEVHPYQTAPWHPQPHDDYEDMDFADLGDNEANPTVRLFMHALEAQHSADRAETTIQYPHHH